jgi:hypothetical protein
VRVLVQLAEQTGRPKDWVEIDSADWATFAAANAGAFLNAINVQGVGLEGDHCHVEDLGVKGCRITMWNDDPGDWTAKDFRAEVWHFQHLAPDARFGGRLNTRQTITIYAPPGNFEHTRGARENTTVLDWSAFVPPAPAMDGVWLTDEQYAAHKTTRALKTWHDWEDQAV